MVSDAQYLGKRGVQRQKGIRVVRHFGTRIHSSGVVRTLIAMPVLAGETLSSLRMDYVGISKESHSCTTLIHNNIGAMFTPFPWGAHGMSLTNDTMDKHGTEFFLTDDFDSEPYAPFGADDRDQTDHLVETARQVNVSQRELIFNRSKLMLPMVGAGNGHCMDQFQTVVGRGKKSYYFATSGYIGIYAYQYTNEAATSFAVTRMDNSVSISSMLAALGQELLVTAIDKQGGGGNENLGAEIRTFYNAIYGGDSFITGGTIRGDGEDEVTNYMTTSAVIKTPYPKPSGEW